MAIGLALMFGLRLPFNFDAPYRALSIRGFWRRWHMTLSRFLRDYLYIPLGGNRGGAARQAANVVLTMLLGRAVARRRLDLRGLGRAARRWRWRSTTSGPAPASVFPPPSPGPGTMLFVLAAWVLFRSPSFPAAASVLAGMAGAHGLATPRLSNESLAALADRLRGRRRRPLQPEGRADRCCAPRLGWPCRRARLLSWLLLLIGGRLPNAFIYFQF